MATDSPWSYQAVTITLQTTQASGWSYAYVTLAPPTGDNEDSAWSYAVVTIDNPHQPIGVFDGVDVEYARIKVGSEVI